MRRWVSHSELETRRLGEQLAEELAPDGVLLLYGDLGSGKTVLAQGVASGLGIDPGEVQSPTFTLMREHTGQTADLYHLDLYRLDPSELSSLGIEELLLERSVKVIEWAERLENPPGNALALELRRHAAEGEREIVEKSRGNGGEA